MKKKVILSLLAVGIVALGSLYLAFDKPKLGGSGRKIISYKIVHSVNYKKPPFYKGLLGGTSTPALIPVKVDMVEYEYVSNEIATGTPYWSKDEIVSNAKVLPKRPDGLQPIAFYAKPLFYKDFGKVYNVKSETITLQEFQTLTGQNIIGKIRGLLIDTAFATTTYTTSTSYTPDETGTVTVLVVGGGGGGGGSDAGGGGAGGIRTSTTYAVTDGVPITITVGVGGAGSPNDASLRGVQGATSTFGTLSANGGGGGGTYYSGSPSHATSDGMPGGSGGGGAYLSNANGNPSIGGTGNLPNTTPLQGYNGGNQTDENYGSGGGGGGAGGVGQIGNANAGNGGIGVSSTITGIDVCYAGGGGGGADGGIGTSTAFCGGGGGGTFPARRAGESGATSTGGGGGGAGGTPGYGGMGGSGVVIVAFNSTTPATVIKAGIIFFE